MLEARKYFNKYIREFDRAAEVRKNLMSMEDSAEIVAYLKNLPEAMTL